MKEIVASLEKKLAFVDLNMEYPTEATVGTPPAHEADPIPEAPSAHEPEPTIPDPTPVSESVPPPVSHTIPAESVPVTVSEPTPKTVTKCYVRKPKSHIVPPT